MIQRSLSKTSAWLFGHAQQSGTPLHPGTKTPPSSSSDDDLEIIERCEASASSQYGVESLSDGFDLASHAEGSQVSYPLDLVGFSHENARPNHDGIPLCPHCYPDSTGEIRFGCIEQHFRCIDEGFPARFLHREDHIKLETPQPHFSKKDAIAYELAGRRAYNSSSDTYRDFRSAAKARKRQNDDLKKYFSYKVVNRGQLGKLHEESQPFFNLNIPFPETQIVAMTKKTLFEAAQIYPKPPRYHRSHHATRCTCNMQFVEAEKRKHAQSDMEREVECWFDGGFVEAVCEQELVEAEFAPEEVASEQDLEKVFEGSETSAGAETGHAEDDA